jgi:hypothetical protein
VCSATAREDGGQDNGNGCGKESRGELEWARGLGDGEPVAGAARSVSAIDNVAPGRYQFDGYELVEQSVEVRVLV